MTKYIYHSEKTKTTCKECSKYNGKIFYDVKDIPELPIHPNCKCWIETVEDKAKEKGKKECDCKDRYEVLINNLNNTINNSNSITESINKEILDCYIDIENNQNNKKLEYIIDNLYSYQNKIKELINKTNNLITDIEVSKEFTFDETYHTKEECKLTKELNVHSKNTSIICKELITLSEEIKKIKEQRKELFKGIKKDNKVQGIITGGTSNVRANKKQKTIKEIPVTDEEMNYYVLSKFGGVFPVAHVCLQDALHDFEYARKNPEARVLNSRDEVKNKDINEALINYKVPKNSRGVYYSFNSEKSNKIANSKEIKEFISKNYDKLINNSMPKENKFEFVSDNDLNLALQHCVLLNPRITSDNYFEATVIDYYDFEYRPIEKTDSFETTMKKDVNNWGFSMQEKGLLENYYVVFL